MTQMVWQVEEAFHVFPDMAGDEINARLKEDPFAFCSVVEATHYEQESEAREEFAKKTSKAVVDGDVLRVSIFSISEGEGEVIEDEPKPGERSFYIPMTTTVEVAPFDEASMQLLEERGIDEEFLMW